MSFKHVKEITNLYLYGTESTPAEKASDTLIRPTSTPNVPYVLNTQEFMSSGGGRFAVGAQFDWVRRFIEGEGALAVNTAAKPYYTKAEVFNALGVVLFNDKQWGMQQYDWRDSTADYAERVYLYNSMSFQVVDDAEFIVNADGTRHVNRFAVIPTITVQENFDFETSDDLAGALNYPLRTYIDPSGIGRRVDINFSGDVLRIDGYDLADYQTEKTKIGTWGGYLNPLELALDGNFLIDQLWDAGVIKFLDGENRPILYGTQGNNAVLASDVNQNMPLLEDFAVNGVVLIGGKGLDFLEGGDEADKLLAGDGDDQAFGGDGADTISGGMGKDSLDGGLGDDVLWGGIGKVSTEAGYTYGPQDFGVDDGVADTLIGGAGKDTIYAGVGDETDAQAGIDHLYGTAGAQTLKGGADTDGISGGGAPVGQFDYLVGGEGADIFEFNTRSIIMDATTEDFISWGGVIANDHAQKINQCAA